MAQREGSRGLAVVADWARKYPLAPRWRREELLWLSAADGVPISAARLTGPPDAPAVVVLVHGFLNSSRSPLVHGFARMLAARAHVVAPDLRGHGRSGGRVTLGALEPLDVDAAVGAAREAWPDLPVVTVGTSLGGIAVLRHAGLVGGVAGTVAISAPAFTIVVHDPDEDFFGEEHARAIYDAARQPKDLWLIPGAGHGSDMLTPDLAARLLAAVASP